MFSGHFYHATIRKVVSVFGTLFNNISVVRKDGTGKVVNMTRVPLAYGPKQKFLARLDEQPDLNSTKVAIKLPRMSFEIISITYDATIKTNRNNMLTVSDAAGNQRAVRNYAPYRIGFQLSIMAKNQDDALQCMEQILPYFQPEYSVTVKDLDDLNVKTDLPFVLTGIQMTDDYEGDFVTRRAIIYTLDFETRVRFYGPVSDRAIIKDVIVNMNDFETETPIERIEVTQSTPTAPIITTISYFSDTDSFYLNVQTGTQAYTVGETVLGTTSGTSGKVASFANNKLLVHDADGKFQLSETVVGSSSGCTRAIASIEPTYK